MPSFPISGVKRSGRLGMVHVEGMPYADLIRLCRQLADHKLNLTWMTCRWQAARGYACSLAVDVDKSPLALEIARRVLDPMAPQAPALHAPAVAVTVFPKGPGQLMPLIMTSRMIRAGLRPLAMATSHAAAVALLSWDELQPALRTITEVFDLPAHAGPAEEAIKVVTTEVGLPDPEDPLTVAVFSEYPVACYQLRAAPGHELTSTLVPMREMREAGPARVCRDHESAGGFMFLLRDDARLWLTTCFCPDSPMAPAGRPASSPLSELGPRAACLVHLQGPHFGHRHGIAALALEGLAAAGVEPLAMAAVVHSIFIALRPEDAAQALDGLGRHFAAPGAARNA